MDSEFQRFWSAYPRKTAKKSAEKAFKSVLKHTDVKTVLSALEQAKDAWRARETQFIPYPATWLRATDFDDEFESREDDKEPSLFDQPVSQYIGHLCTRCLLWHHHRCRDCEGTWCPEPNDLPCEKALRKMHR